MDHSEGYRNAARVFKEGAMECYKAGMLGRAQDKAYVASSFFPELPGLRRLNAVLQVLTGYDKKINGSVDWYAVLGACPYDDVPTIQKQYRQLFLDMTMDDGESLDGTYKANKILSESWKFLCNVKGKKLYDERRRYELQLRDQQLRLRDLQLRNSLFYPWVLSAPKPNISNEQMVQPPPHAFRVSGGERKQNASSSTTVTHVNKGRKNSEDAPKDCLEVLEAFTKNDIKKFKNLVETPKEEAVNGVVGSEKNVASHYDETMNNLGTEGTKETEVKDWKIKEKMD